jgi:hypothetical protein
MIYLGLAMMLFSGMMECCWTIVEEQLGVKVRTFYLKSLMKKEVSWFDINRDG